MHWKWWWIFGLFHPFSLIIRRSAEYCSPSSVLQHRTVYKWFSWGRDLTFGGKSQGLCLVQLCSRYRLVSATLSSYHQYWIIKEAASLKVNGPLDSCLLIIVFEIGRLIDIWKPSALYVEYRMGGFCLYCKWNRMGVACVCRIAAETFILLFRILLGLVSFRLLSFRLL